MSQILSRLLIIALLFGSAEAAIDSVHIDSGHNDGSNHVVHDHAELDTNVDHDQDSCEHYCHCTQQLGALLSNTASVHQKYFVDANSYYFQYRYQPHSSLYRPPII